MWIAIPILVALAAVAAWHFLFRTYHLSVVQPNVLVRDGLRSLNEYGHALQRMKVKTVVSLLDDQELLDPDEPQLGQEEAYLKSKGIKLERVKIKLGGWPMGDDVSRFIAIVNDPVNQPVLVHCAQGVRRTGMMVAAWQMSKMKLTREQATKEILTFGHSERSIGDVRKFIERYDPVTMQMTEVLPMSKE